MAVSSGRILDAAAVLAAEDPDRFTVDRVAERAGVPRATVYRRFDGRDGLFAALRDERGIDVQATIDTRSRILEAAALEFARSGIHGASIVAIADGAGVNPQSAYNHFGDKETLLSELLAAEAPRGLVTATATAAAGNLDGAIRDFVHGAVESSREQHDLLSTILVPDPITKRAFQRSMAQAGDAGSHLAAALEHADLPEGIGHSSRHPVSWA